MRKLVLLALAVGWVILGGIGSEVAPAAARIVPLPSTLPLLGLGLGALFASRRSRK